MAGTWPTTSGSVPMCMSSTWGHTSPRPDPAAQPDGGPWFTHHSRPLWSASSLALHHLHRALVPFNVRPSHRACRQVLSDSFQGLYAGNFIILPLTYGQILVITVPSHRTSLGVCQFGGSSTARGRVSRERSTSLQAQGATGRYYQGGQAPLLLPETGREKARESRAGS